MRVDSEKSGLKVLQCRWLHELQRPAWIMRAVLRIVMEELLESAKTPLPADYMFACFDWFSAIQASKMVYKNR